MVLLQGDTEVFFLNKKKSHYFKSHLEKNVPSTILEFKNEFGC